MRLIELDGQRLPVPVDVYGWRWPEAGGGELASKAVFEMIDRLGHAKKPDSGVGVYRTRMVDRATGEVGGDWYVFVVDVNLGLLGRSKPLRALKAERVEPDPDMARKLAMRHLRTMLEGWDREERGIPTTAHQRASYPDGVRLDDSGNVRPP